QRQRVAMGRAIVRQPQVFCMDEPLSNLDAKLRVSTRAQIAALQQRLGVTTVYVTHDQVEAMTMGDRVAVLKDGVLQQVDTPLALYDDPANLFVAGFIGSPAMNLLDAKATEDGVRLGDYVVPLDRSSLAHADRRALKIGVRPEALRLVGDGDTGLPVEVMVVEELGADAFLYGTAATQAGPAEVVARIDARRPPAKGSSVRLGADPERVLVFDADTGERLAG
ncbi:MAG TPA: TOBE domain-containing protein, partial [Nocardioidaceae bacterium]|nr:TOBE domain-containing protein [Nocardioidaceae bacterium]